VDALYSRAQTAALEVPVRYQDGRTGVLRAQVRLGGDTQDTVRGPSQSNVSTKPLEAWT